jgi:D-tyrosyl-tRNA(Tyr) deacylase
MKAVLQRVSRARVLVDGAPVGAIERGLLVFLGVMEGDDEAAAQRLVERIARYRVFPDPEGRMNLDLGAVGGALLVVSQFTLAADGRKGRRPSFDAAAEPARAEALYRHFLERARALVGPVEAGVFGAPMTVEIVNEGPATFLLES